MSTTNGSANGSANGPTNGAGAHNAVEKAYAHIYNQTVNFGFHPGERINEVELAASLGMSRAPVREALNRLVARNLVLFEAGKGFFCRKLSTTEVAELFEIRSDLETAAIKSACLKADEAALHAVVDKWQNYGLDQKAIDTDSMILIDEEFHLELASLGHNEERLKFLKSINERIRFVRRIHIESLEVRNSFLEDHRAILDALAKRDVDIALAVMEKHFAVNTAALKANITEGLAKIYADAVA